MLDKVIYFSGIHSAGKSTLIEDLAKREDFVRYEKHLNVKLEDTYHRMVFRLSRYWIEAKEMDALSASNPGRTVLGDRCVYDNFAYGLGFIKLGWISEEDYEHSRGIFEKTFRENERPKNIVNVRPPLEWVAERLKKRWETKPKKWREDNQDYLREVVNAFPQFYSQLKGCNILELEETDREKRVKLVLDWAGSLGLVKQSLLQAS